jgi:rod shape-determining protein MreC
MNKGSGSGVETGMCVITDNGEVVGLVVEVGPNYAEVKTVLDSSLEISATIATSGYSGMVQGGYATGNDGMLRMNYLTSDSVIRNNDQVVTSGSTVYPRDLILGYVVDAGFDETGVAKFAILEPAADFGSLEQVFVVTQFGVE